MEIQQKEIRFSAAQRRFACAYGLITHLVFLFAILCMAHGLFTGLEYARLGSLLQFNLTQRTTLQWLTNTILLLQFPLLHSFLLGNRGRRLLEKCTPFGLGAELRTTTFALISSLQLIALFELWIPSQVALWRPELGAMATTWYLAYLASWLYLIKTLFDAGLSIQLGYLGWAAVSRGKAPRYPDFRPRGTFLTMRHPVYLAFAMVLWSGPVWTLDHLVVSSVLSLYCALGPLLKEVRYLRYFGETYQRYCHRTPYFAFPLRPTSLRRARSGT